MGDIKMGKLSLQSDSRQKMKRNILTTGEDAEMQYHRGSRSECTEVHEGNCSMISKMEL